MKLAFCGKTALDFLFADRSLRLCKKATFDLGKTLSRGEILRRLAGESFPYEAREVHLAIVGDGRGVRRRAEICNGAKRCSVAFRSFDPALYHDAFLDCGEYIISSPELCFLEAAAELSFIDTLLIGFKLCGDYRPADVRFRTGEAPLTSIDRMARFIETHPGAHGAKPARRALKYLCDNSNSHMESRLALMLSLPRHLGGYGLSLPCLNQPIPGNSRKGDLCWFEKGVVVEYDSRTHHSTEDHQDRDAGRVIEMELKGIRVVTLRHAHVFDDAKFDQAAQLITRSLKEERPIRTEGYLRKRQKLKWSLFHRPGSVDDGC